MRNYFLHQRFIQSVHRRLIVIRGIEHLGVCIAGCSLICLAILPILFYRNQSAFFLIIAMTMLSVLASTAMTFKKWPSVMMAATEADQQFELADLLSTAMALTESRLLPTDVFSEIVLASADEKCKRLSASDLILNRLGARAWGGIGLSAAMVIAMGAMPFQPKNLSASDSETASMVDAIAPVNHSSSPNLTALEQSTNHLSPRGADDDHRGESKSKSEIKTATDDINLNHQHSAGDGGSGSTAKTSNALPPLKNPSELAATKRQTLSTTGIAVGGAGAEAISGIAGNFGGISTDKVNAKSIAPWTADNWNEARLSADQTISSGQIPDRYHTIIHQFFDRDPAR